MLKSGHILLFCVFAAFAARCRLRRAVRFFLILMWLCHPRGIAAKSVGENTLWLAVTALRKRQSRALQTDETTTKNTYSKMCPDFR